MKKAFKAAAYVCAGIAGIAAAMWDAGKCSGMTLVMILLAMGICIFLCRHEAAVIEAYEKEEKEAIQRSAWKAEFMREVDKPV